ncbi:hypothetical protein D8B26_005355 [Coccidioides posadasii str. Silveira]|uniref:uncharacterized protein n=1 Tax=Coccidioides posadasii (strain RMSCC 757 / Silveira) TaxID=443226 RepID=UPI001BF0DAD1|nr:hypothetical protein D8B26_005355 [Coccidioides posadasii str. Silveira]
MTDPSLALDKVCNHLKNPDEANENSQQSDAGSDRFDGASGDRPRTQTKPTTTEINDVSRPTRGDKVTVAYNGYLYDRKTGCRGKRIDTTEERGDFTFHLGTGKVIQGFENAVLSLAKGAACSVIISPEEAYMDRGFPGLIPPNSTLAFDIHLKEIHKAAVLPCKNFTVFSQMYTSVVNGHGAEFSDLGKIILRCLFFRARQHDPLIKARVLDASAPHSAWKVKVGILQRGMVQGVVLDPWLSLREIDRAMYRLGQVTVMISRRRIRLALPRQD